MPKKKRRLGDTEAYITAVKECQRRFSGKSLYACESGVDYLFDAERGRALGDRRRRRR